MTLDTLITALQTYEDARGTLRESVYDGRDTTEAQEAVRRAEGAVFTRVPRTDPVVQAHRLGAGGYHVIITKRDGSRAPYNGRRWGFTTADGAMSELVHISSPKMQATAAIIFVD